MALSEKARKLLLEIAKCKHCPNPGQGHKPCQTIFDYQQKEGIDDLLPVPWQGHIEKARILFIGSNPSELNKNGIKGVLANKSWLDSNEFDTIIDIFEGRFDKRDDQDSHKWSHCGIRYRPELVRPIQKWLQVQYWRVLKNDWALQLLFKVTDGRTIIPGADYALTEIVHCYSKKEKGVQQAKDNCSDLYFQRILECAVNAKTIAIMGEHATQIMNHYLKSPSDLVIGNEKELDWHPLVDIYIKGVKTNKKLPGLIKGTLKGRQLNFIALPHPGAVQYPTCLELYLRPDELKEL